MSSRRKGKTVLQSLGFYSFVALVFALQWAKDHWALVILAIAIVALAVFVILHILQPRNKNRAQYPHLSTKTDIIPRKRVL